MKKYFLLAVCIFAGLKNVTLLAQANDSSQTKVKKTCNTYKQLKPFILPAALFTYGLVTPSIKGLKNTDLTLKQNIVYNNPHRFVKIDNYLQYTPALGVYALHLFGNKGKNNIQDVTKILLLSHIISTASVVSIKHIAKRLRPDSSAYNSFPSGHTTEAFENATFLMIEYKNKSIWYGIAGYAAAAATGYLRMYNNKHWLSDIAAGAAVGIASAQFSYWLYPKLRNKLNKNNQTLILPSYNNQSFSMNVVHYF